MSGWLAIFSKEPLVRQDCWRRSLQQAAKYGERVESYFGGHGALAVWRREHGEFPVSGKIYKSVAGVRVAWIGQCLEDFGDSSLDTIRLLQSSHTLRNEDLARLNGPFAAAVLSEDKPSLKIINDKHCHYPLYRWHNEFIEIISTDLRCLLPWMPSPQIDPMALDFFLRVGELIDRRTLLKDVEFIAPASHIAIDMEKNTECRYWQMKHCPDNEVATPQLAKELGSRLRRAVQRVESTNAQLGVPLSGGLDSRFLLGLCANPASVPSFTWGYPDCRDVIYATEFSRRVGSPHHVRSWKEETFPELWQDAVDRTGGCFIVRDMYIFPYTPLLSQHCEVVLNGLAGDVFLGGNFVKRDWISEKSLDGLARKSWRWRVKESEDVLVDSLMDSPEDGRIGQNLWRQSILSDESASPCARLNDWLYENRIFRFTNNGTVLLRSQVESHSPFFDRDFVDLLLRVPFELKLKHRLYMDVLNSACPKAMGIRWQRTGIPPKWGFMASLSSMAIHKMMALAGHKIGMEPFPKMKVADPAAWLRGAWRAPAESLILSDRFLSRGLVNPDRVNDIWQGHQNGADNSKVLAALITVELLCRQVMD
jgi:asparagine synthetase B (glutamine-hydrolysing)